LILTPSAPVAYAIDGNSSSAIAPLDLQQRQYVVYTRRPFANE